MVRHLPRRARRAIDPDRGPRYARRAESGRRLSAHDLTPRGWNVVTVAGTMLLAVLLAGAGVLSPGLPARNAVPGSDVSAQPSAEPTATTDQGPSGDPLEPQVPGTEQPENTEPPEKSEPPENTEPPEKSEPPKKSKPPKIPEEGSGQFTRATAELDNKRETGQVIRYTVQVEQELPIDPDKAAAVIHKVLNDKRSWAGDGSITWVFTPSGQVDLTAYIATPSTTDQYCAPLNTRGELSCRNGGRIMLNAIRWTRGVEHFEGDLVGYRQYLVNHEFGHFLGYDHVECPGAGQPAPVMMTQTIGLGRCTKNPWPANDP